MKNYQCFKPLALTHKAITAIVLIASSTTWAQSIHMASTTSTEQSGLFSHLLPAFKAVIPARYASSRLPAKPLLDLGGKPMV